MTGATVMLLVVSVLLSSAAQLLLKIGVSAPGLQTVMKAGDPVATAMQLFSSAWIIMGGAAYVLSAGVWLIVLSKSPVSQAYPCVALAFVVTLIGGHFILAENLSLVRMMGVGMILLGVLVVART